MEPDEFKAMVQEIRNAEKALGKATYKLSDRAKKSRELSRSLFVVADVRRGEILSEKNVRSIRPGFGLHPKFLSSVLGRRAGRDIEKGTPLKWSQVDK